MRFSRHQLLALVLGAGMTSALPAQTGTAPPRPPRAVGARGAGAGAMRRPTGPAAMMITQRDQLSLTDDQVTQLQTLEAATPATPASFADMMQLRKELQAASTGEANLDAARAAMDKIGKLESDMLVARLDARNKARAVLTADQQAKFDSLEAAHPMPLPGMGGPPAGGPAGGRGGMRRPGAPPPPPPAS